MKGKIKKIGVSVVLISIGFVIGMAMPLVINAEGNDANVGQVLKGKTFTSSLVGIAKEGAIEDFSKSIITKSVNATNDNFIETIELTPGYYDQIQVNTENVYNAGKAAGSGIEGNAADASKILKDYKAYVNGELITGTMANIGTATINTTAATGNVTTNITPGYYDKVTVNQTTAYNAGVAAGQSGKTYTYLSSNWNAHGDGRYITNFSANCDVGDLVIFAFGGTSWGTSVSVSGGTLVKNDFKNMNGNSTYAVELVVVRATSTTVSISGPQLPCGGVIISKIH